MAKRQSKQDFLETHNMQQMIGLLLCLVCHAASAEWFYEYRVLFSDICDTVHSYYESHSIGYCKLDRNCTGNGPCCITGYDTYVEESSDRYDCVSAQFLSGTETKYNYRDYHGIDAHWMITKCQPDYTDLSIIQRCTNPGFDGSLDSIIPVTLVTTDEVFRNKFCVLCNNIELHDNIIYWNLDIHADSLLKFPETNLVNRIKLNRENIFFTPPRFVRLPSRAQCNNFEFTNKCNDTEIWSAYFSDMDMACGPFIDTINISYNSLLCYVCIHENAIGAHSENKQQCYEEPPRYESVKPKYTIPVSRDVALGLTSLERLQCDSSQFYDKASKVCRDILCFNNATLHNHRDCGTKFVCYEVYIKASAVKGNLPADDIIENERYIEKMLAEIPGYETIAQLSLFYHADAFGWLDYFLLHVIADEYWELLHDHTQGIYYVNETIRVLRFTSDGEIYDKYALHVVSYNVSNDEGISSMDARKLNERNAKGDLHAVKNFIFSKCNQVATFNKIRACPYLQMPLNAYHLSVKGDNLILKDNSATSKQEHVFELLEWEYMIKGDQLQICVSDMIKLLSFLPNPERNAASSVLKHLVFLSSIYIFYNYF